MLLEIMRGQPGPARVRVRLSLHQPLHRQRQEQQWGDLSLRGQVLGLYSRICWGWNLGILEVTAA